MNNWLRRIRGALGMGLVWGVFGFVAGGALELIHNIWPNSITGAVDIWPAVLGFPAFLGGIGFSTVLGIAGRRRRLSELSVPGVALWGALGGIGVGLFPAVTIALGWGSTSLPLWQLAAGVGIPCAIGGAVAASASLMLARRAEGRMLHEAAGDLSDLGLTAEESRDLLGEG